MDRSQSHARYGFESSLVGRWLREIVGGGGSLKGSVVSGKLVNVRVEEWNVVTNGVELLD